MPAAGTSFDILDEANLTGTFTSVQLPSLNGDLAWVTTQLYTTGVITVILKGDFNYDGVVDAADYILWRHSYGHLVAPYTNGDGDGNGFVSPEDYQIWQANFGHSVGTGLGSSATVPEPAASVLVLIGMAIVVSTFGSRLNRAGSKQFPTSRLTPTLMLLF